MSSSLPEPVEVSAQRARAAYAALATAGSYAEARDRWTDFLTHWRRALGGCDAQGRRANRRTYVGSLARAAREPALANQLDIIEIDRRQELRLVEWFEARFPDQRHQPSAWCQSNGNPSPVRRNFPNPSLALAHDPPPLSQGG